MCDSGSGLVFTPIGYQGPAQHTYTPACDGFHEPGQCPRTSTASQVTWARDYIRTTYGQGPEDSE